MISVGCLLAWLRGEDTLPRRPLLITFDDGYRDTYDVIWPVLKKYELPSVLFVATDYIGGTRPFDWDMAAYCFHHTTRRQAHLPLMGSRTWNGDEEREGLMNEWVRLLLRQASDVRLEAVDRLPQALDVRISDNVFRGLCLTWEQVCEMSASGMEIGSHTRTHVVMNRSSPERAREELSQSKSRILQECGHSPRAFAYPNGVLTTELERLVKAGGYQLAFSTQPGPSSLPAVMNRPLAIRRIGVSRKDGPYRFLGKLVGLVRLKRRMTW